MMTCKDGWVGCQVVCLTWGIRTVQRQAQARHPPPSLGYCRSAVPHRTEDCFSRDDFGTLMETPSMRFEP